MLTTHEPALANPVGQALHSHGSHNSPAGLVKIALRIGEVTSRAVPPTTEPAAAAGVFDYPEYKRGVLAGIASYGMWGVLPLFWPLLKPAGPVEILAHRMVWSLLFVLLVLWMAGGFGRLRALFADRRRLGLLAIAAALITVNWGAYIWGVNNGHVVETALGYFVGPLVSVVVGVLLLGERLRGLQWAAVGLGTVAVVVIAIGYGRPPWVALLLAFPFAVYGLVKKLAAAGAVESLAVETTLTSVPALVYLGVLEGSGSGTFATQGIGHTLLLATTGAVTALPLLAFGAAATRIPLSMVGLLQYIAPVLQFLLGVLVFRERMPAERWVGFALVWLGLVILSWDGFRRRRRVEVR
jgi:chloramphenicol-sensitive protein RarD